jgi:hypothetical protein
VTVTLARLPHETQRTVLALAAARIKLRRSVTPITNPVEWVTVKLREHLWSSQAAIAQSVRDNRSTAVQSCHGAGKSFTASRIAAWWLSTHEPGDAFVISTAPSFGQVRVILWREIGKAHRRGHLIGRLNQTEWFIGEELVGMGRKPNDYDESAFQGIHARYVLVIVDEAGGVPKSLFDAAITLTTNADSRILAIGNPDDPGSYFATICKPGSGWNVMKISAFDTPNFTGEAVPEVVSEGLVSTLWVEERRKEWGEDSPLYVSKVKGEFPVAAADSLVRYEDVLACQRLEEDMSDGPSVLGVDVGAGGDYSVIRERKGNKAGQTWTDHTADPESIVKKVMFAIRETGASIVNIDIIGVGHGIAGHLRDLCRQAGLDVEIVGVNVAEKSSDPERFVNLRAEIWWTIGRELSRDKAWDLSDVDDNAIAQLVATKYQIERRSGRIIAEAKEQVRKRLGRSPDDADALLLAFYRAPVVYEDQGVVYDDRVQISPY